MFSTWSSEGSAATLVGVCPRVVRDTHAGGGGRSDGKLAFTFDALEVGDGDDEGDATAHCRCR